MQSTTSLFLVDDEVVDLKSGRFRVQAWRAQDKTPILVLIQVPGGPPPQYFVSRLTQIAFQQFLGCAMPVPIVYCYQKSKEARGHRTVAQRVAFDVIGNEHRPIFCDPKLVSVNHAKLERVFRLEPVS